MWEVLLPLISFWMSFRVTPKKIDALLSEKSGAAQNNAEFAAPEAVRAASVQLTARAYKDLRDYMDEVYLLAKTRSTPARRLSCIRNMWAYSL